MIFKIQNDLDIMYIRMYNVIAAPPRPAREATELPNWCNISGKSTPLPPLYKIVPVRQNINVALKLLRQSAPLPYLFVIDNK